jgi:hypothetical protein
MNQIPAIQTTEKQMERLRAQHALYSRAKTLLGIHIALSVPFAVLWSILGIFFPETKIYAAVWGIGVALLDLALFTPQRKTLKSKAAKIQEAFDCDVLGLDWRSIRAGSRPDPEEIVEWSSPRRADPKAKVNDWYPAVVGQLSLPLARAVCQRANCWWDAELRRRYARASIGVVATILGISVITGIIGHFQVEQWILTGVAPLVPVFMLGLRQSIEQRDAADRLDALRRHAEKMWAEILAGTSGDKITQESRELQDEIFDHRRRNPLIFDWIYNLLRNRQEEQMNRAAADLIQEAQTCLRLNP